MAGPKFRERWRTAMRGAGTSLGITSLGFFVPFRWAASVPRVPPEYAAFRALFAASEGAIAGVLDAIASRRVDLAAAFAGPLAGHWNGSYFGRLDSAAAFALVCEGAPKRIVEVGSGSSTHVMVAAGRLLTTPPEIVCIDPAPRSEIDALGVVRERAVLSEKHLGLFEALQPGDVAFFDSSHVLHQGTDVDIILNRILPVLKPGVLVHVHDVFLPDPYPEEWHHRAYSEQLGLAGWLFGAPERVVFASNYAGTRMAPRVAEALTGLPAGLSTGGSLWFRR